MIDSNGTTLAEYWHSGGLHDLIVADLEGNGKQEIIATGVAHGYDSQATDPGCGRMDHVRRETLRLLAPLRRTLGRYQVRGRGWGRPGLYAMYKS